MLASAPDPTTLYSFLEVVTYLAVLGVALRKLFERHPKHTDLATKQEVEVALDKKADKKDLQRIEAEIAEIEEDIDGLGKTISEKLDEVQKSLLLEIKGFSEEARKGRVQIWNKVNPDSERIAKLEAQTEKKG